MTHGKPSAIATVKGARTTRASLKQRLNLQKFWKGLVSLLDPAFETRRIDCLSCCTAAGREGKELIKDLETLTATNFAASDDETKVGDFYLETDGVHAGELYFDVDKLSKWEGSAKLHDDVKEAAAQLHASAYGRPALSCAGLCEGRAWLPYNIVCAPFMLTWRSISTYLLPCTGAYAGRCLGKCLCGCCRYEDSDFHGEAALGELKSVDAKAVTWVRAPELVAPMKPFLFNGIEPSDLAQGALGDCWLLAALSSLAEHPNAIRRCFVQLERSVRGKYSVRMYDAGKKLWQVVLVDDRIPTNGGKPVFAVPQGGEVWAVIMEKAFAKFFGSYGSLNGGHGIWAWQALTGDDVFRVELDRKAAQWERWELVPAKPGASRRDVGFRDSGQRFSHEDIFRLVQRYDERRAVMAASISNKGEAKRQDGLVAGHLYSLLQAKKVGDTAVLQLRNPWGSWEWKGAWSDRSKEYKDNAGLLSGGKPKDDGSFWMSFKDFATIFDHIDICDRSTDSDLALDTREATLGCPGPLVGCLTGCASY